MQINTKKGFSLVEILVSISIVSVLFVVVLFNYSSSNDNLTVTASAQELAVAIRQTQSYALSVKEAGVSTNTFNVAYGLYVNPTLYPNTYFIFVDRNGDKVFDSSGTCGSNTAECVERISLKNGVTVNSICNATPTCPPPGGVFAMDILFARPNPEAKIYLTNNSNPGGIISGPVASSQIKLRSPKGKIVTVTINSSGNVLIQ